MGWDNAFWCEIDDFCRTVLSYHFPKSTGYGNIKETDFTPWRGKIDILTGGFPCQPFSCAGQRKGAEDDRYLWPEMLRAIREIRPSWVIGENVAGILSMVQPGDETEVERQASLFETADKETLLEQQFVVDTVCRDLEREGYSVQPVVIPACAIGAPHRRDRVFFIAYRTDAGVEGMRSEWENSIHGLGITSYPECEGGGQIRQEVQPKQSDGQRIDSYGCEWDVANPDIQELQERIETGGWEDTAKTGTGLDNGVERFGGLRYAPNATGEGLEGYIYSGREKNERGENFFRDDLTGLREKRDWRDFPTQSPVCRGNDGLPFDVVRLAIPFNKWREGSVKGYGNAIVPQVIYEIFKAIETVSETS